MRVRRKKIQEIAAKLLEQSGVDAPPVPVEKLARDLGLKVRLQPFQGELSGVMFREGDTAIIGVNAVHHPNRQRFTIAHELGHFLLHEGDPIFIDKIYRVNLRDAVSSEGTDVKEIEANHFAAELLMPERFLANDLAGKEFDIEDSSFIEKLASRYRVSPQALALRLMNR